MSQCSEMARRKAAGYLVSDTDHSWHPTMTAQLFRCGYCGEYRNDKRGRQA